MGLLDKVFGKTTGSDGVDQIQSVSDQSQDEQKLISFVKKRIDECRMANSRVSNEGIWMTNIAYLMGYDGVFFDTNARTFRNTANTQIGFRRSRVHVNKILPTVQNRLARLCKNPPKYDVRPESSSVDDKDATRLSLQILEVLWEKQKLNEKRIPLVMWVQQCGHAYLKVSFDDQLGKPMIDPTSGKLSYEGEVRVDIASAFEVYADPLAKTSDDVQWYIQAKVRKLDYFKTHYPERGHIVKEEGPWLLSAQYDMRINSINTRGQSQANTQGQMKNAAIELAYYEKRSEKYPNGRLVVTANGVLLADKELPVGELPFVKFDDVVVGGKYLSESIITHMRPIQDQYNRIISQRARWANLMLTGKYLVARGAGLTQESLNDESGEVVEYNPVPNAGVPQAMQIPAIPQYAYQEEEKLEKMLYDIAGINEVSRGQLPAAGMPAIGMQFLMEQDDTRIGIVTEQHEHSWARLGSLALQYVEKFYTMPRVLKIAGPNQEYEVKSFVGADIRGNHDVIVIRGSTVPGSKALKRQEIINTFNLGLLGKQDNPQVQENVLKILEFGDVAEMWQDQAIDMSQIKRTIEEIEQEIQPIVSELDNHSLHIQEKNRYRKTDKFDALTDHAKECLLIDIEQHINQLMGITNPGLKQQQQQAQQDASDLQQMGPSPGGPEMMPPEEMPQGTEPQ